MVHQQSNSNTKQTREVDSRHVINELNASKFSKDDINDMTNEMLLEMDRLRRDSLTKNSDKGGNSHEESLDNINKHVREFSDSLDAKTIGNISKDYEITSPTSGDAMNGNAPLPDPPTIDTNSSMISNASDISNAVSISISLSSQGSNRGGSRPQVVNSKPSRVTPISTTKEDGELDATLIDTIDQSLGSKKKFMKIRWIAS